MKTYRRLLSEILNFRGQFIAAMIFGVLWSLAQAQLAVRARPLFDKLSRDTEAFQTLGLHDAVIREVAIILGFFLFSLFARYWHMFLNNYTADCVSVAMRRKLNSKFLRLDLSYQNKLDSGSGTLMSRLLNDVGQVENGIGLFADFLREPLLAVYLISHLFYLDYQLTLVLIFGLPVVIFVMRRISRSLRKYSGRALGELESMTSVVKEGLDGSRVIQSFNLQKEMQRRFENVAKKYLAARKKLQSRTELSGPLSETIAGLLLCTMILYMALRISRGDASVGDLISYFAAIVMLQQPIKKLQDSYAKFQRTVASADRIFDIIDNGPEIVDAPDAVDFPRDWQKIEYRNVTFAYDKDPVLKNFNLTINRGEMVAFVGESGSGKTTIVNLLERFFEVTEGEILVDGIRIEKIKVHDLRQNIGLVTQDVFLFNDTIDYNIHSGDFSKPKEVIESAARSANAHNFIAAKPQGYETRVGDRGGMLSGGERQRVSIARAFVKDAPILILDEATSALDSASEIEVQKGLEELMQGRTVLVIAHRLSTVMKADKIVVLKNGEIVEVGNHQTLVEKKGEYYRFRQLQAT